MAKAKASPAPQFEVVDRGRPRTPKPFLARVVAATLAFVEQPELPVSLLLTDDAEIARLHGEFLADPTPTDVISFALEDGAELVVSVETAARCARAAGTAVRAEVALYVIHGLLHVCGFDDVRQAQRQRMRKAERAVLAHLQLAVARVDD